MLEALFPYQPDDPRQLFAAARVIADAGVRRLWLTHSLGLDAQLLVAATAARRPELEFGTAVSLMATRHPLQAAVDARTLAVLTGGRFSLGLGVSEPEIVRHTLGQAWAPGPEYAHEYLTVVRSLLHRGAVRHDGRLLRVDAQLPALPCPPPPLVLGALGPKMARVAGELADGCICWLTTPERIEQVIVPAVREGAETAGREPPDVIALVPATLTDDPSQADLVASHAFGRHLSRPHYRRVLAEQQLSSDGSSWSPATRDALLAWGDAEAIGERLRSYLAAGAARVGVAAHLVGDNPLEHFTQTLRAAASALRPVSSRGAV